MRFLLLVVIAAAGGAFFGFHSFAYYVLLGIALLIIRPFRSSSEPTSGGDESKSNFTVLQLHSVDEVPQPIPEPIDGAPADGATSPIPTRPAARPARSGVIAACGCAVLAVVAAIGVLMIVVGRGETPRAGDSETPRASPQQTIATDPVAGELWSPAACEERLFPQLHGPLASEFGATTGWRWRAAEAHVFCAHQWDADRLEHAAGILEQNHLLLSQWNARYVDAARKTAFEKYGVDMPGIYEGFPPPVASLFKILDAAVVFLADEKQLAAMRKTATALPSSATISNVRRELRLDDDFTAADAKPQRYDINASSPRIRLITDLGLRTSIRAAYQEAASSTFSKTAQSARRFVETLGVTMPESQANVLAAMPVMMLQIYFKYGAVERQRLGGGAQTLRPLSDVDIYFLSRFRDPVARKLNGRIAAFDRAASSIFVTRLRTVDSTIDLIRLPKATTGDAFFPAALWHEFDHYLFDELSAPTNGFMIEGFATAIGEHERRSAVAGWSVGPSEPIQAKKTEIEEKMERGELTDNEAAEWKAMSDQYIRRSPMTEMQCTFLTLAWRGYVQSGADVPIVRMLSLTPRMFQSPQFGDVTANYATAWAVVNFAALEDPTKLSALRTVAELVNANRPITGAARTTASELSSLTRDWLKRTYARRGELCSDSVRSSTVETR